jgi:hypothetical protein
VLVKLRVEVIGDREAVGGIIEGSESLLSR